MERSPGTLALVGGGEWSEGCTFDAGFLAASGSDDVLILPTAAAYEHPERLVVQAGEWFGPLGGQVEGLMVLSRADAEDDGAAGVMRKARLIYLAGGSPMHLRSVLKGSKVWSALLGAWQDGAVVVGSSAAAMVLTDPMVDARGGGLTIGLGLLSGLAVVPHFGDAPRGHPRREAAPIGAAGAPWHAGGGDPRADGADPGPFREMAQRGRGSGGGVPQRCPGRIRARRSARLTRTQTGLGMSGGLPVGLTPSGLNPSPSDSALPTGPEPAEPVRPGRSGPGPPGPACPSRLADARTCPECSPIRPR